jgi:protein-S-isoprenylcysteine O-methyltransferase Ste14
LFVFYQVPLEEKVMQKRFGETYLRYKRKVPRWFGIKGGLKS